MSDEIRLNESIGILAARHAGIRAAIEEMGFDYYCAGDLTLDDAARAAGRDSFAVLSRLKEAQRGDPGINWQDRSMRDLIRHLEHEHHQLLRSIVFHAAMLFNDVVAAHEAQCATLIRCTFRQLSSELIRHIEKEEHTLFPMLGSIEDAWVKGEAPPMANGEVRRAIAALVLEHAAISHQVSKLHDESRAIEPPGSDACRRLLHSLTELERHVHEYLNLENYVVFPRALALDDDLHSSSPALTATMLRR